MESCACPMSAYSWPAKAEVRREQVLRRACSVRAQASHEQSNDRHLDQGLARLDLALIVLGQTPVANQPGGIQPYLDQSICSGGMSVGAQTFLRRGGWATICADQPKGCSIHSLPLSFPL